MRIAIIDDERPARRELFYQLREILPDSEITEADSGAKALELFQTERFDLLFIEVNLGDVSGIVLASVVQKLMPQARIVFATAHSEYAVKAFEMGVTDYILKPFEKARLETAIQRCGAPTDIPAFSLDNKLVIRSNSRMFLINTQDIVYVETYNRGSTVHTVTAAYSDSLTIGEYERKLAPHRFYRIHKSYLVNMDMVSELFLWQANSFAVKLKGVDQVFPVSRERAKELRKLLCI